eukprot:IDg7226t1
MYQLSNELKDSYFINTLGNPARTFYLNNYKGVRNFEQCPPQFCSDDQKIAFLHGTIIGSPYAVVPTRKADSGSIYSTQFATDLQAVVSLKSEKPPGMYANMVQTPETDPMLHFADSGAQIQQLVLLDLPISFSQKLADARSGTNASKNGSRVTSAMEAAFETRYSAACDRGSTAHT